MRVSDHQARNHQAAGAVRLLFRARKSGHRPDLLDLVIKQDVPIRLIGIEVKHICVCQRLHVNESLLSRYRPSP